MTKEHLKSHYVGAIVLIILLIPILNAPILADDLVNPFNIGRIAEQSILEGFKLGFEDGTSHHINLVGSSFGTFFFIIWLKFNAFLGLSHLAFYILLKIGIYLFVWNGLNTFLILQLRNSNLLNVPKNAISVISAIFFAGILQLHQIWSNDPVANYPLSGFASVGFALLSINFVLKNQDSKNWYIRIVGCLLVYTSIFYYEMNIGVLATISFVFLSKGFRPAVKSLNYFFWVFIPALLFLVIWLGSRVNARNYDGTTFGSLTQFPFTFMISLLSGLPGFGWILSFRHLQIHSIDLIFVLIFFFTFRFVFTRIDTLLVKKNVKLSKERSAKYLILKLAAPLLIYGLIANAIIASTSKYQGEIRMIGQVYNSYAPLTIVVTILLCLFWLNSRISHGAFSRSKVPVNLVSIILSLQLIINFNLADTAHNYSQKSQTLVGTFDANSSDLQRCSAWVQWSRENWPVYYRISMGMGLSDSFEHYYGAKFCSNRDLFPY